jgi:hypothetical protein
MQAAERAWGWSLVTHTDGFCQPISPYQPQSIVRYTNLKQITRGGRH